MSSKGGMAVTELINPKSSGFKKMALELSQITEQEAAGLINEHPKIMRRPLLTDGNNLIAGFDLKKFAEMAE